MFLLILPDYYIPTDSWRGEGKGRRGEKGRREKTQLYHPIREVEC